MSLARATGVFIGTDESTGVTIANNASSTGSEVTMLADDTSAGMMNLFLVFTGAGTTGTLDIYLNQRRVTGQSYEGPNPTISVKPISGTAKYPIGTFPVSRYMNARILNNGTGGNVTNVTLGYEIFKAS